MRNADHPNVSNLHSLNSNINILNQAYFKELRASVATARDSVLVLEKVVSFPGKISLTISEVKLTLLPIQKLLGSINVLKSAEAPLRSFRDAIGVYGEEARKIDVSLGGGTYANPLERKGLTEKAFGVLKDSAMGRPGERAALTSLGVKDLVIATRVVLDALEGQMSLIAVAIPTLDNQSTASVIDKISDGIELRFDSMTSVNTVAQLNLSGFEVTTNFLNETVMLADEAARLENEKVEQYLDNLVGIKAALDAVSAVFSLRLHILDAVSDLVEQLADIRSAIDSVLDPLDFVADAFGVLEPFLDLISFLLAPFEAAFDYALEASGLQGFLNDLTSKLLGSFGNFNSILELDVALNDIFNVLFDVLNKIDGPISALTKYLAEYLLTSLDQPIVGSNDIVSSIKFGTKAADYLTGTSGDDALVGGQGNDILDGFGGVDRAIYTGKIADYSFTKEADGTTWTISDLRTGGGQSLDGTDTLLNVEELIFSDTVVDIASIDGQFILTGSNDSLYATVAVDASQAGVALPSWYHNVFYSTSGRDYILGGVGYDDIYGGEGDDVIFTTENTSSAWFYGPGDRVDAGPGDDFIIISNYYDTVLGGPGNDTASFQRFAAGATGIFLGVDGDDNLFRPESGITMNYSGGEGSLGRIYEIQNLVGSKFADIFYGSRMANIISGREGNDVIRGLGGNDILNGDRGDDVLLGDRGDDTVFGAEGFDLFVGGLGDDVYFGGLDDNMLLYSSEVTIRSGPASRFRDRLDAVEFETTGYVDQNYDLPDYIVVAPIDAALSDDETLVIVNKYDASGELTGQDTLKDIQLIHGTDGDDTFHGSDYVSQTMIGGDGNDSFIAGNVVSAYGDWGIFGDIFHGGAGDDSFVGSSAREVFYAETGNDTVFISGSDYLGGDSYSGKIRSGERNTIDLSESDYAWRIAFDASKSYMFLGGKQNADPSLEDDTPILAETIVSNFQLFEHPRQQSSLVGGYVRVTNFNVFIGSEFDDIISFGGQFDHGSSENYIEAFGGAGNDIIFGAQTGGAIYGGEGDDLLGTYNGYEIVRNSSFKQKISLFDTDVSTTLDGGNGDDRFIAGDSQETFIGGAGIDWLSYKATTDLGRDNAVTDVSQEGVVVDLVAGMGSSGFAKGDVISGIENLTGSENDDEISGDFNSNWLVGLGGDDTISGAGGDDIVHGGAGLDQLYGGEGRDVLAGGEGNDVIRGGLGDDHLTGGSGDDILRGDEGADILVATSGSEVLDGGAGFDVAVFNGHSSDFLIVNSGGYTSVSRGDDVARVENIERIQFDNAYITNGQTFDNVKAPLIITVPLNEIDGDGANNILVGTGGGDLIRGFNGNDHIYADGFELRYALPEANQVFRLYQATLNRTPDEGGHERWTSELFAETSSLEQVRLGFVGSQEFKNKYAGLDDAGFVKQIYINVLDRDFEQGEVTQTEIDNWTNRITDTFTRADVVNGFAESPQLISNTIQVASKLAVNSNAASWSDDVYRLYQATLDRAPDMTGFANWSGRLADGRALTDIIPSFTNSQEFANTYGPLSDPEDFVKQLYNNVLGRDFDLDEVMQIEIDGWTSRLSETYTRANIVQGFSQSREFTNNTADGVKAWIRANGVDDQVEGGAGTNVLAGGSLADHFVFAQADAASNTVLDLEAWDYLSFDGFGYRTAAEARAHMVQSASSVVFADQGTEITFERLQLTDITDDMIFV
jgi:Ca2+-binding RTX toxin-like protein